MRSSFHPRALAMLKDFSVQTLFMGVLTAFVGVPFFLLLLRHFKNRL